MEKVYVWDRFVRFFHWALVALFCTSYLTGDEIEWLHVYSGYGIALLILARALWGFIGSTHARFRDFLYSPLSAIEYLKSLTRGEPKNYLGHNPAGAMMVFALLIGLFLTTLSGMKLYAIEEGKGPLADAVGLQIVSKAYADSDEYEQDEDDHKTKGGYGEENHEAAEEFWEEIHEFAVNFMIFLIIIHVVGVIVSSGAHSESLVKAMITGYKERRYNG